MAQNRISGEMSDADKAKFLDLIKQATDLVADKTVTLTPDERKTMRRLGPGSVDYADANREAVETFPTAYPADFGADEFVRDAKLLVPLAACHAAVGNLFSLLEDTTMQLNSEVMTKADESYELLKGRVKRDGKYKPIVERIKQRFVKQGRRGTKPKL